MRTAWPIGTSTLPRSEPYLPPLRVPVRRIGARTFDFSRQVAVMAVVNRTPDSFFDQGRTYAFDRAVDACFEAVALGADWVDIGGAPFAPGEPVPVEEEIERVVPVVAALRAGSDVVISVDTFHAAVAREAIAAGATVINDTTGLRDPDVRAQILRGHQASETRWAVHAGGRSVLDAVESALDLPAEALAASRSVLARFGNMSSATLMFVLADMMDGPSIDHGVGLAFGPGLAAEGFAFQCA